MSDPVEFVDLGGGQSVSVGGVQIRGETENNETSGQQAPTKSAENGYVYTTRIGPTATEGVITGWVNPDELPALKALADEKSPIPVSTPEGSYSQCVVDTVERNMAGVQPDAYNITINWREILQASTSTSRVRAITNDGAKSGGAGGPNDGSQGRATLADVNNATVSDGPDTAAGAKQGAQADGGDGGGDAAQTGGGVNRGQREGATGGIAQTVMGWVT